MYCAYITTINGIRKHSDADRLQCVSVFGNNVIVDMSYHDGKRVIFFPTDGQLSEEFATENNLVRKKDENGNNIGGYLDPNKRNIKPLKLRGERSEGLVLPLESLAKYCNIEDLKDGDKITALNGVEICRKYIPKTNMARVNYNNKSKNKQTCNIKYPFFEEHVDTYQLAYNQSAFSEGDLCYITLKMHGTSARTSNAIEVITQRKPWILKKLGFKDKISKKYECISGTRRVVLNDYDGGYYGSNEFRRKYHDLFKEKLPKGVEVFYEIVGWSDAGKTIMGKCNNKLVKDKEFSKKYGSETIFSYGCEQGESDCYVYRMTFTNEDGVKFELPWHQVQIECEKMGVKCVPTFDKFIFTTWEDLLERVERYYEGEDPIGKTHVREGVVVRIDNKDSFCAYKHKNFEFKCIEGIIKDTSDEPDIEEVQELINES